MIREDMIKITEYNLKGKLPDPFLFDDGKKVRTVDDWEKRREEIYKTAVDLQYGGEVPKPEVFSVEPLYIGKSNPASYRITAGREGKTLSFTMYVFKASTTEKLPSVITGDMCFPYPFNPEYVKAFTDNKINLVAFNRTELFPDIAEYNLSGVIKDTNEYRDMNKVVGSFNDGKRLGALSEVYPEYKFGAISAWAWGYSRCTDALEYLGFADMGCIAFTGHSRGGKTAMLAGAVDKRAAIVNPNAACAGGCSCYRLQIKAVKEDGAEAVSEPLSNIFHHFPLWMGEGMREYIDKEENLPFDSHYLKAMVAPRVLFVSEAASDIMSNPVGSWQTTMGAKEVYKFLGCEENLLWYFRSGGHAHANEDLLQLVNVIRHYKWGDELNDKYFKLPFKAPELAFDFRAE